MPVINRSKTHIKSTPYVHDNKSAKFYNSKYWQNLRNYYIVTHPLCEECLKNNKTTPAEHVHHIKEFLRGKDEDERWSLLLNENNLMSVCVKCHNKLHHKHLT